MNKKAEILMKKSTTVKTLISRDEPWGSMNGEQRVEGVFQLVNFTITPADKDRNSNVLTPNNSLRETKVFTINLESKGYKTTINLPNDKNNDKNIETK